MREGEARFSHPDASIENERGGAAAEEVCQQAWLEQMTQKK